MCNAFHNTFYTAPHRNYVRSTVSIYYCNHRVRSVDRLKVSHSRCVPCCAQRIRAKQIQIKQHCRTHAGFYFSTKSRTCCCCSQKVKIAPRRFRVLSTSRFDIICKRCLEFFFFFFFHIKCHRVYNTYITMLIVCSWSRSKRRRINFST